MNCESRKRLLLVDETVREEKKYTMCQSLISNLNLINHRLIGKLKLKGAVLKAHNFRVPTRHYIYTLFLGHCMQCILMLFILISEVLGTGSCSVV